MAFGSCVYDARATMAGWRLYRRAWRHHQKWSVDERRAWQYERLRALLIDASEYIPYYHSLFEALGFEPRVDFRSLDDLTRLPILTKEEVRAHQEALRRQPLPPGSICERTSGSTGQPLAVWISQAQITVEKATVWRHWRSVGYRPFSSMAVVRTYVPRAGEPLWRQDRWRRFLYVSAYHLDAENAGALLDRIAQFRPRFLRGYPTALAILGDFARVRGQRLPSLRGILTASETLTADTRLKLQGAFGVPVFDWYGLAEQVVTASQCACGDGLHRHEDYGLWELLPLDDGSDRLRIVGTNLHSTAMPLIRYDTGDLASGEIEAPCPCGSRFPRISSIAGRQDDELVLPSGRRIPSVNFYSVFRAFPHIRRFQMIQQRGDAVEVRVDADELRADDAQMILAALGDRLGSGVSVRIIRTGRFERTPQGKQRTVISRVSERATTEAAA